MTDETTEQRLERLRQTLRAEVMSYGDYAELQDLAQEIEPGDVELLEPAGVPESQAYVEKGKRDMEADKETEFDIIVVFQVTGQTEDEAAERLGYIIGHSPLLVPGAGIESWYFPNHKHVDGNDIPYTAVLIADEKALAERQAIVQGIEDAIRG